LSASAAKAKRPRPQANYYGGGEIAGLEVDIADIAGEGFVPLLWEGAGAATDG